MVRMPQAKAGSGGQDRSRFHPSVGAEEVQRAHAQPLDVDVGRDHRRQVDDLARHRNAAAAWHAADGHLAQHDEGQQTNGGGAEVARCHRFRQCDMTPWRSQLPKSGRPVAPLSHPDCTRRWRVSQPILVGPGRGQAGSKGRGSRVPGRAERSPWTLDLEPWNPRTLDPRTLDGGPSRPRTPTLPVPHRADIEVQPLLALAPPALEVGDAQRGGPGGGALAADDEAAAAAARLHADGDVDVAVVRRSGSPSRGSLPAAPAPRRAAAAVAARPRRPRPAPPTRADCPCRHSADGSAGSRPASWPTLPVPEE